MKKIILTLALTILFTVNSNAAALSPNTQFHFAILDQEFDPELMNQLIDEGANVNGYYKSTEGPFTHLQAAYAIAINNNDLSRMNYLLEKKADPDFTLDQRTILGRTVEHIYYANSKEELNTVVEMVKLLVDHDANPCALPNRAKKSAYERLKEINKETEIKSENLKFALNIHAYRSEKKIKIKKQLELKLKYIKASLSIMDLSFYCSSR
ncbi:MAG: hypothetical protein CL678_01335 [Bdellovibrionaceae bacterium]|nr:hypothetical protein [Pseudobdellovibrionaceae bacterium]|tara:strand:- start:187 stop:816 length:630 start_codon:yes stop_codon:yes gene_type:complete